MPTAGEIWYGSQWIRPCPLAKSFIVQMAFRMHPTSAAGCN